jgi:YHS domain-containing protein
MMTVEVFVRGGTEHGREIAERLLHELITEESAPESVLEGGRALTHVLVREPVVWATGGDEEQPRYLVRVTVPESWNTPGFAAYVVPRVTDLIASFEDDPGRLRREPHCVVQVVGLGGHALGTLGRVTTDTDITRLMTDAYRSSPDQREVPPGHAVDPVCGMAVDLARASTTLEHEGRTYAFCSPVCRQVFTEEHPN